MSKPTRLYETKHQRAARLGVGVWFVWPSTLPRRNKYYQPRVYRALDGGVSAPVYEDFGVWQHEGGVNSPDAAYARASDVAAYLNAVNADEDAARAYVKKLVAARVAGALGDLNAMLGDKRP